MQRIVFAALAALAAAIVSMPGPAEAQSRHWNEGYFPSLSVVTHEGKTVRFYEDLIKGKIVIINFIFTSCTDICPLTTARLTQVEDKLGDLVGRDIFIISMTVDPENDTPERMKAFAKAFGVGPGGSLSPASPRTSGPSTPSSESEARS